MCKKNLNQCRKWRDFRSYAQNKCESNPDLDYDTSGGNHDRVRRSGYRDIPLSRGSGEPGPGLRKSLIKQLAGIGLILAFIIVCFL